MSGVRRFAPVLVLAMASIVAGCGSSASSATPVACLEPTSRYLTALEAAPGEVRLGGEIAISDCFSDTQGAGDQATVGQTVIKAATVLNARARRHPAGAATVGLGYLDGAVRKGTSGAEGIYADLVRRVEAAARFSPGGGSPGAAFERAFGKGYAAGESTG
jgi:hypothetical protein